MSALWQAVARKPAAGRSERPQQLVDRMLECIAGNDPKGLAAALAAAETSDEDMAGRCDDLVKAAVGTVPFSPVLADALLQSSLCSRETRDLRWFSAAVQASALPALRHLASAGLDINARSRDGVTCLYMAARRGRVALVQELIRLGADPLCKPTTGRTPLTLVALLMPHDAPPALGEAAPLASANFAPFLDSEELSDIQLRMDDGRVIHAHRIVLAAQSDFFRAMFGARWAEGSQEQVPLSDVGADVATHLLEYLYTGACSPPLDNLQLVFDILACATRLILPGLVRLCEHRLAARVVAGSSTALEVGRPYNVDAAKHRPGSSSIPATPHPALPVPSLSPRPYHSSLGPLRVSFPAFPPLSPAHPGFRSVAPGGSAHLPCRPPVLGPRARATLRTHHPHDLRRAVAR